MAVVRWQMYDPITTTTWTLPVNPHDANSPQRKKKITEEGTTATDGQIILFEGPDEVKRLEWSGKIFDQATFDLWNTWFEKRHQIRLTDDLGRVFWIYVESFEPRRVRSAIYPWKHDYTARAIVMKIGA